MRPYLEGSSALALQVWTLVSSRKKEEVSTEEQLLEVLVDNKDEEDAEEEEDAVEEEDAEEVEPQRLKFWYSIGVGDPFWK